MRYQKTQYAHVKEIADSILSLSKVVLAYTFIWKGFRIDLYFHIKMKNVLLISINP